MRRSDERVTTCSVLGGRRACAFALLAVATGLAGCRPQSTAPPPLGEAVLVVDTDLPVPALAGRLRVDLFTTDGTWYAARDLALPHASDWPASFAVALADGEAARDVARWAPTAAALGTTAVRCWRRPCGAPRPRPARHRIRASAA